MRQLISYFFVLFSSTALWALPTLTQLSPKVGAAIGEEVEIQFYGNFLKTTQSVITYKPGLEFIEFKSKEAKKVIAKFRVKKDAKPSIVPLRLLTDRGMTDLRLFKIYQNKSIEEKEPNTKPEEGQLIEKVTTIRGIIKREDVDRFNVVLKKGETLSAQVEGYRFNGRLFDSHITLLDENGRELTNNDDNTLTRQDSGISVVIPKDGTYQIAIREASYQGRDDEYMIHVGTYVRPSTLFPLAGAPNSEVEVKLIGSASEKSPKQKLKFPSEEGQFSFFPKGSSTPNYYQVIKGKHIMEKEPNNNSKETQDINIAPPFVVHGVIATENDYDEFTFNVKKGQKYEVRAYARSYGSSLDAQVYIYNEKYKYITNNDDKNGADSKLTFKADADGKHRLKIKDYLTTYSDSHVYAVEVIPETPRVSATLLTNKTRTQQLQTVSVPQNGRMAALMSVERINAKAHLGFNFEDLPEGITAHSKPVHEKVTKVPVVFNSSNTTKQGYSLASVKIKSTDPKQNLTGHFNQKIDLTYGNPNNAIYHNEIVNKLAIASVAATPFKVSVVPFKSPIVRYGSKYIKIKVDRNEDFKEEVKLKLLMNIPGVSASLEKKVPKDKTEGLYSLNANGGATLGKWPCAVIAWAKVDGHDVYTSTELFELEVSEPYILANIDMAAVSQGQKIDVSCILDQKKSFEGDAKVRLYGLPGKAKANEITINKTMKEAFFNVTTDIATPKGQHKSLFLNVTVMENGEPIVHNIGGGGTLRVDPPPKKAPPKPKVATKKEVKPKRKSRLEILREQLLSKNG